MGKYSFDTDSAHHLPTYIESELKIIGLMGCTLGLICSIEPRNWFFAFSVGHIVTLYKWMYFLNDQKEIINQSGKNSHSDKCRIF